MRWLFLLLVVLNGFYYVWHQQEVPLRAKLVMPLSLYKGDQQGIRLLSESDQQSSGKEPRKSAGEAAQDCLYLGVDSGQEELNAVVQRLASLDVVAQPQVSKDPSTPGFWLQISPETRGVLDEEMLRALSRDFKDLKHKIMPCEGIATVG